MQETCGPMQLITMKGIMIKHSVHVQHLMVEYPTLHLALLVMTTIVRLGLCPVLNK